MRKIGPIVDLRCQPRCRGECPAERTHILKARSLWRCGLDSPEVSIGHESAAQLLLTAGDNVQRLRSEASFAALCGISPVPASSGKTTRHRLSRGGDRAANSALNIIAIGRLRTDPRTQAYVARRITEGHSKLEAIRCVKRYIAREVFSLIKQRQKESHPASTQFDPLRRSECEFFAVVRSGQPARLAALRIVQVVRGREPANTRGRAP